MRILRIVALSALYLTASSLFGQSQVEANKKVVYDFYRYVWEPQIVDNFSKYAADTYIEHNPLFAGGKEGLLREMKSGRFQKRTQKVEEKLTDPPELITAEGDLVTWIFKRTRKDKEGKEYQAYWFDTFRVRNGKIVEHWDGATRP